MFDPITLGISAGLTVAGNFTSILGSRKQAKLEQRYLKESNFLNAQQAKLSKEVSEQSLLKERARREQANLDYSRTQREIVRRAQLARSLSLTRGASQGALFSSGVLGGVAQASQQEVMDQTELNQNFKLGNQIFDATERIFNIQNRQADIGSRQNQLEANFRINSSRNKNQSNLGSTISQAGMTLFNNSDVISRVFGK